MARSSAARAAAASALDDGREPVPVPARVETALAAATDAWSPPVWIRRGRAYFLIALVFCLILCSAGEAVGNKVPTYTGLSHALGWVIGLSVVGVLGALILLALSLHPRSDRQVGWALLPILSLSVLAWWPSLVVAVIRRWARDWAVFAAFLAAVAVEIAFGVAGGPGSTAGSIADAMIPLVAGTAALHALVAFRPAAGVPTWREARAARAAAKSQQPVVSAVPPEEWQQDAGPDHLKPIATDSGGPDAKYPPHIHGG
jgi:hypothetical protein